MLPHTSPLELVGDANPHVPKYSVIVSSRPKFSSRPAGQHHRLEGIEQHQQHDREAEDCSDKSHGWNWIDPWLRAAGIVSPSPWPTIACCADYRLLSIGTLHVLGN